MKNDLQKTRKLAVLMIEDSLSGAAIVARTLINAGYDVDYERVDTPEALLSALSRRAWDVVISDYVMPAMDGRTALSIVQGSGLDIPFIAVSGVIGEEMAVEMMRAGAHDYVMKSNLHRLAPAVERELAQAAERSERRRAEREIRQRQALLEEVLNLGKQISAIATLPACLSEIRRIIEKKLGIDRARVYLYDPERDTLTPTGLDTSPSQNPGELTRIQQSRIDLWLNALTDPRGLDWLEDFTASTNPPPSHELYGVRQLATLVAWAGSTPVAMIAVDNSESGRPIQPRTLEALELFAGYAGPAIANAQLHASLEQRVAERTAELQRSEAELRESRDQISAANSALERAARLKDEFLASMSHELRTPLTGILGISEAMQMQMYGELTEKQTRLIKNIAESGHHLLDLINDILDLSKIEAGQLEMHFEICSVDEVCQACMQLTKGLAQQRGHSVRLEINPPGIQIQADPRRLKQMLVNLLSNAIKFTPEGGQLGLRVTADASEQTVSFSVWDHGIGIAPGEMRKLFQPFQQIDSSLGRQNAGTGLGLSLVQRMASQHGGSVSVESMAGHGSTFTIHLPMDQEAAPAQAGAAEAAAPVTASAHGPTAAVPAKGCKVLIADDMAANLEMLTDFLKMQGYEVYPVMSGYALLEQANNQRPDVLLVDIQMPGIDGLETIRRLRKLPDAAIARTPAIAFTALAMQGDRERCLQAGADDYLSKPVALPVLLERIEYWRKAGAAR